MDYETCYDYSHTIREIDHILRAPQPVKSDTYVRKTLKTFRKYGWRKSYIRKQFRYLTRETMAEMQTMVFIQEWAKYLLHTRMGNYDCSLVDLLHTIGLRFKVIKRIVYACENLLPIFSKRQFYNIILECILKKHKSFPYTTTFRYCPTITERWIPTEIPYINMSKSCMIDRFMDNERYIENKLKRLREISPKITAEFSKFFFYTTSWIKCDRIMAYRMDYSNGRTYTDFQRSKAIYLYEDSKDAVEFGYMMRRLYHNEIAILVFALPTTPPEHLNFKYLYGDEWKELTQKTHDEYKDTAYFENRESYSQHGNTDFIYGNAVANPSAIYQKNADPQPHNPPKKQLACVSDEASKYLTSHMVGILYFKKGRS